MEKFWRRRHHGREKESQEHQNASKVGEEAILEGILPSSGPQVAQLSPLKFLTHKAASKIKWLF